jgi:preprotein translocase subunit SecG
LGLLAKTFYYLNILVLVVVILIQLGQYAYAISGYDSGYNHGCDDAKIADPSERYINQPERGPNFHSDAFMQGYKSGFNSCSVQQYNNLPPSDSPSQTLSLPTMTDQGDETSFGIAIIILLLFFISSIALAIRKFKRRDKRRERQHFSDSVKQNLLRKQDHKCAYCKRILNVVDWDHKNGNRSNNTESNCQALCPNCHAIKTRSARK